MPKYGPRKGKERYAREMMDEIAHKQTLLAKALGVPVSQVPELSDAQLADIDRVTRDAVVSRDPARHAYVVTPDDSHLAAEVEKSVRRGRALLESLIATPGRRRRC